MKLFPFKPDTTNNLTALILRLATVMMIIYGWKKMINFSEKVEAFPDPLHVGHTISLSLTIFAEFFCGILVLAGFFTRWATLPLIFCMVVIIFVIDRGQPFMDSQNAILYCMFYIAILVIGPGKYSLDHVIRKTY